MAAFKMHEIRELIRLVDESDIEEFEIDNEGAKLTIKKSSSSKSGSMVSRPLEKLEPVVEEGVAPVKEEYSKAPTPQPKEKELEDHTLHKIVSPMVGTFYRSPSPDSSSYVNEGDKVDKESVVCIVEAMKLMNEIEAEVKGTIVKVLVENNELVEYGQPLFLVKTD